jgi:hypothetical protein
VSEWASERARVGGWVLQRNGRVVVWETRDTK